MRHAWVGGRHVLRDGVSTQINELEELEELELARALELHLAERA